jgi:hypothetical protein
MLSAADNATGDYVLEGIREVGSKLVLTRDSAPGPLHGKTNPNGRCKLEKP